MALDVIKLSERYNVRRLEEMDVPRILAVGEENPVYYQHMQSRVSKESILEDMRAFPPGKDPEDKYYVGFFEGDMLVAVMDLIDGYPNEETAYIGFFMMNGKEQGKGKGTEIIRETAAYLKAQGFSFVRLGFVKGNRQSEAFWKKNGFQPTGSEKEEEKYTVVVLQKEL